MTVQLSASPQGGKAHTLAPAKINLLLGVSSERDERGYHRVTTIMCPLDLSDVVCVEELAHRAEGGEPHIELTCVPDPVGDPRANLAYRAADALARALGRTPLLRIAVEKRIPSQAGLGGGSSDAAATLRCLAALWGLEATDPVVVDVARGLGADVPFFLYGGTCLMGDLGDAFIERLALPRLPIVLVKPPVGVSTPAAYRAFDELGTPVPAVDDLLSLLRPRPGADVSAGPIAAACANNLQPAACAVEPLVAETLVWLDKQPEGLAKPLLCGSGACCALFVSDALAAREVAGRASAQGLWACATETQLT